MTAELEKSARTFANGAAELGKSSGTRSQEVSKISWSKKQRLRVRDQRAQKMTATSSDSSSQSSSNSSSKGKSKNHTNLGHTLAAAALKNKNKSKTKFPELLPQTFVEGTLFSVALGIGAVGICIPYDPRSIQFFFAQALVWSISTAFFCLSRQLAWERTFPFDGGNPPGWRESLPCWAFEASALIQIVFYVPSTFIVFLKIAVSWQTFVQSYSLIGGDYTDSVWLEHFLFSSLFGFMIRDFALHVKRPDPLLTAHHVAVCLMMVSASFFPIRGFRLLALILPVVELGSCAYCYWCIHRCLKFYTIMMTFSNISWAVGCSLCTFPNDYTYFQLFLLLVVFAMVAGRQLVMLQEIRG